MQQHEIAAIFSRMADLLEFQSDNPFRIRAYRRAAQNLESFNGNLRAMADAKRLQELSGIGPDLADKITEYLSTGAIAAFERLQRSIPRGIVGLMEVPGIGPKTAKLLSERLRIANIRQLEAAAKAHRLRTLPGFQAKKEDNILKGLEIAKQGAARMHLGVALARVQEVLELLRAVKGVSKVSTAGSLRRMKETIGDLDVLVATTTPARVMSTVTGSPLCVRVLASGSMKSSVITKDGIQVDVRVIAPESFGAALVYFTGSKEHNVRLRELAIKQGLKINEYGVFKAKTNALVTSGREEADVYRVVGLPWIPPELREDAGEIDAAKAHRLPSLVELRDIRGDFHIHSTWSDGSDSLESLARAGTARGYEYLAMCDHSQSLKIAHGMTVARLKQQAAAIKKINASSRCRLLLGAEVDILRDGAMDYPDEALAGLDFVVGSIHSGFTQDEATLTRRMIRAMRNPYVTLIAHPTGRLMGQREPYVLDLEAVYKAATDTHTAMEINAYPRRLDLCDTAARRASRLGVMLALSTDTHSLDQLDHMAIGVGVARRAWLEPKHLLNCASLKQLLQWVARKRARVPVRG